MADHTEFVELAKELLLEEGTLVTLQIQGATPSDSSKPWNIEFQEDVAMEYRNVSAAVLSVIGKDFGTVIVDLDLLKRTKKIFLTEAPAEGLEDQIHTVKDADNISWRVVWSQSLKPADQTIVYLFGVSR